MFSLLFKIESKFKIIVFIIALPKQYEFDIQYHFAIFDFVNSKLPDLQGYAALPAI